MALFAGLPRAYGVYEVPTASNAKGKREGGAQTLQAPVTEELWDRHLAGEIQLGIVPIRDDASCVFGAIDVDDYKTDHKKLHSNIVKMKLPLVMCRSKSGGAHLYAFFKEPVPAERVRELLAGWAASLGYASVEIFPKQSALYSTQDTGNWINMPYSGGDNTERYAIDKDRLSTEEFLKLAERARIGAEILDSTDQFPELLTEAPPCLITLSNSGIPEGQRNNTMFALAIYCRKRWPEGWEEKLPEMNEAFVDPPLTTAEVAEVIKNVSKKEYNYPCKQEPICNVCQRNVCKSRQFGVNSAQQVNTIGFSLENVVRLEVEPVTYYADYANTRVTFGSRHLCTQAKMRELLVEQTNVVPPRLTGRAYDAWVSAVTAKALRVEAPKETNTSIRTLSLITDYCSKGEQRPWALLSEGGTRNHEHKTYFNPHAVVNDINVRHKIDLTESELWTALQDLGAQHEEKTINRRVLMLWSIPEINKDQHDDEEI